MSRMSRTPRALLSTAWFAYIVHQSSGIVAKSTASRAQFLSAATASFFTSAAMVTATAEECKADTNKNPRYIQQELDMKYADGPDGNPRTRGVLVRRVSLV